MRKIESKKLKKFEDGKWYKLTADDETFVRYNKRSLNVNYGTWKGEWRTDIFLSKPIFWEEATEKEILAILKKELTNRGFYEGCKCLGPVSQYTKLFTYDLIYNNEEDLLTDLKKRNVFYKNGAFSLIRSLFTINGYKLRKLDGYYGDFGVYEIGDIQFQYYELEGIINHHNQMREVGLDLTIKIDDIEISLEQLLSLKEFIDKEML